MKAIKVFLSFEFGKDDELHHNFYRQARECSEYDITDYSLNEQYHPDKQWLKKARKQISLSDIVIVVIGEDTHNAAGVEKEVTEANKLHKPIFQIRPKKRTSGKVRGAGDLIQWNWKRIDAKIAELLDN